MKKLLLSGFLFLLSCTAGEKGESANNVLGSDSLKTDSILNVTATHKKEAEATPRWNVDSLLNILEREEIIGHGPRSAEFTSFHTIQVEKLNEPNTIQGIGIIYDKYVEEQQIPREFVMIAFFDTSGEVPNLIAWLDLGQRGDHTFVKFNKVELAPGQFATTVTYDIQEEGSEYGQTFKENRSEVLYYVLKESEVIGIFDYVQSRKRIEQGAEGHYQEYTEKNEANLGMLKAGQLCSINLVSEGTQFDGKESKTYIFKEDQYLNN